MTESHQSRKPWAARILVVLFFAVAVPVAASILYTYSPTEHSYLPCPFHWLTGLHCPFCGSTRCVYSLMHGNIRQALAYNSLLVILLPMIGYVGVRMVIELWTDRSAPGVNFPIWLQRSLIVLVVTYWIARNIDVIPLSLLAPHEI